MNRERLKEFILFLKDRTKVESAELIEKDFYLNVLLAALKSDEYAFKGGTCLSKVYLDYHRLSEDLDFTFISQEIFDGKTTKQVKKICSERMYSFGDMIKEASGKYGIDFKMEKSNKRYVEIGSNNKLVTFKVWYRSVFTEAESFIKVQITFVELLKFPIRQMDVLPILDVNTLSQVERKYFEEFLAFYLPLKYLVYDIREIACEKVRAILTRRGFKTRDALDLFFIEKVKSISLDDLREGCVDKIIFAIENYEKYAENFRKTEKIQLVEAMLVTERTAHLLLGKIDEKKFSEFLGGLSKFLEDTKARIKS